MRRYRVPAIIAGLTPLLFCTPALCDSIAVSMTNDGTDPIVLTVYDTSVRPQAVVLSQRVNGFATIPVTISQDATGHANLAWSAVTVDPDNRRCGHARHSGLTSSDSVNVHADAACTPPAAGTDAGKTS